MFPDYEPILKVNVNNDTENIETTNYGKSLLFDFTIGDFVVKDGEIQTVEGIEELKQWVKKILITEKNKYKIYEKVGDEDNEYGVSFYEILYSNYPPFINAEIQREVTEVLLKNSEIINVYDFNFIRDKRALTVSFTVESIYGTISEELNF